MLNDQRLAPRISCSLSAQIEVLFGDSIEVEIVDISTMGCQIVGGEGLTTLDSKLISGPMELALIFSLHGRTLHVFCRVIYKRRESQTRCSLGLRWSSMSEAEAELIRQYLETQLGTLVQSKASA